MFVELGRDAATRTVRAAGVEPDQVWLDLVYMSGPGQSTLFSAFAPNGAWPTGQNAVIKTDASSMLAGASSPSMCLYNDQLYLVYQGAGPMGPTGALYVAVFDGAKWSGGESIALLPGQIMPKSDTYPAMVVMGGLLYLIYKVSGSNDMHYAWFDGTTWFGDRPVQDASGTVAQTDQGLDAVCAPLGTLDTGWIVFVYRAPGDGSLRVANFDGVRWTVNTPLSGPPGFAPKSSRNPAIAVLPDGSIVIVYPDVTTSELRVSRFVASSGWSGDVPISSYPNHIVAASEYSPTMAPLGGGAVVVYKQLGTGELHQLSFDGNVCLGGAAISGPPSTPAVQSAARPALAAIPVTPSATDWLRDLPDNRLIVDINLPGTHDSAAINPLLHTAYACHANSITQQLQAGIRLLDVRLQVVPQTGGGYTFNTCHGALGSLSSLNVYQSFASLLDECQTFLQQHPKEFIAMSLKIDDPASGWNTPEIASQLQGVLAHYPVRYAQAASIPLAQVRGSIYVFNRGIDPSLGYSLVWSDNTPGQTLPADNTRQFAAYVQDYWSFPVTDLTPVDDKTDAFFTATSHGAPGQLLLNFGSATQLGTGVYIHREFMGWMGERAPRQRPAKLGWTLWDYETLAVGTDRYGYLNPVQLVIASNDPDYGAYGETFALTWF